MQSLCKGELGSHTAVLSILSLSQVPGERVWPSLFRSVAYIHHYKHLQLFFWCLYPLFSKPNTCQLLLFVKSAVFEFWLWNWSVKEGKMLFRKVIPDRKLEPAVLIFHFVHWLVSQLVRDYLKPAGFPELP